MNNEGSIRTPLPNDHLCIPVLSCLFQYSKEGCFNDKIKMVGHDNVSKSFSIVVAAHGAFSMANSQLCIPVLSCLFQYSKEGCFNDEIKMVGHDNVNKSFSVVVAAPHIE
jgi:hypothetical protein